MRTEDVFLLWHAVQKLARLVVGSRAAGVLAPCVGRGAGVPGPQAAWAGPGPVGLLGREELRAAAPGPGEPCPRGACAAVPGPRLGTARGSVAPAQLAGARPGHGGCSERAGRRAARGWVKYKPVR